MSEYAGAGNVDRRGRFARNDRMAGCNQTPLPFRAFFRLFLVEFLF